MSLLVEINSRVVKFPQIPSPRGFCFIEWRNKDYGSFGIKPLYISVRFWFWLCCELEEYVRIDRLIGCLKVSLLVVMNSRVEGVRLLQTRVEALCTSVRFWL